MFEGNINDKHVNYAKLVALWRQDPILASKDIFGIELDTPQRVSMRHRWLHDTHFDIFTRGGGKTFLNSLYTGLRSILYPGNRIGIIAPSFRQSKMVFGELERLYERSPIFQQSCVKPPARHPEACYVKLKAAEGKVGSLVEALPIGNDGAKIRGARYFEAVVDEVAQIPSDVLDIVVRGFMATSSEPMERVRMMREQREMLDAGLITEDQIKKPPANKTIYTSTAWYQYNHLWERISNVIEDTWLTVERLKRKNKPIPENLKCLGGPLNNGQIPARVLSNGKRGMCAFPYTDLSEGFMNLETILESKRDMSEYQFLMEYFCYFPPDSEGYFRRSTLDAARGHGVYGPAIEPRKGAHYVIGIDPARVSDNFAIALYEVWPELGEIRLVRVWAYEKKPFPEMHRILRGLIRKWDIQYIKMDAGGGGRTIRDLLADQVSCPVGEQLILERDLDEHRMLQGRRLLGPLVQFSKYDWCQEANTNLLSALQHGRCTIASVPPVAGEIYVPAMDEADEQIEQTLVEMSSIVTIPVGNRLRWDTPTKTQRKDRYSAALIGFDAAREYLGTHNRPQTLATGGWLGEM